MSQQCLCQKGCHGGNVQKASHRLRGAPLRLSPALYLATIFRTEPDAAHSTSSPVARVGLATMLQVDAPPMKID